MPIICALLALFLAACSSLSTRSVSADAKSCYWSIDGLRYNHFFLALKPDKTYEIKLIGDIGTWGEASGAWEQEAGIVSLTQSAGGSGIKFPTTFEIQSNGTLRLEYHGAGYSSGGTDLIPSKCAP
jgi:hypothetical protein